VGRAGPLSKLLLGRTLSNPGWCAVPLNCILVEQNKTIFQENTPANYSLHIFLDGGCKYFLQY